MDGGGSGTPARVQLERADGEQLEIGKQRLAMRPGDRLVVTTGGGGGVGDPRARERAAVERDLREGKISAARAREVYGLDER